MNATDVVPKFVVPTNVVAPNVAFVGMVKVADVAVTPVGVIAEPAKVQVEPVNPVPAIVTDAPRVAEADGLAAGASPMFRLTVPEVPAGFVTETA